MMISDTPFGRRRKSRLPRVLFLSSVVLFVVMVYLWRAPLSSLLWQLLTPVVSVRNALGGDDRARAELNTLKARLADRDALYKENLELKALLGRAAGRSVTIAAVLQRPPGSAYDTFMVDAGQDEGVLAGSHVSLGGSALVGVVDEVYAQSARVRLYSSPGSVHEGTLVAKGKNISLSIEGKGGGSLRAQVPAGTGAKAGDPVQIPGIGMGLMATVAHVEVREGESFETIYFTLPGDLNARLVEIWQ